MSYNHLITEIEDRNKARQAEWREKALARRGQKSKKSSSDTYDELSNGGYNDDDYLPEQRVPAADMIRQRRRQPAIPDWLFMSIPNDSLYSIMCYLWGGEMASCSQVCRELYKVLGETVVSQFLQHFGGRHPRRMMRNVLFRMVEKIRVRSVTNLKGILLWSSHHGYLTAVRNCIADERWHPKMKLRRPSDGATPLYLAAEQNNLPIVRALLARGVDINLGTFESFSPLHAAANEGHTNVARFLIDAKADLNKTDSNKFTPIMLAAGQGHAKIVRLLAEAGVKVDTATRLSTANQDEGGETALHRACEKGHAEMVGLLLDMDTTDVMVNSVTGQGRTPLIVAAEEGQLEVVNILLAKGADVHATTNAGKSALYLGCERGHVELCKTLLEAGADPGQASCRKKIPLYTAAEQGNLPMVKVLLPYTTKAHLFIETTYGTTPLFIATRSGNTNVKDLLVEFCSRGKKKRRGPTASLAQAPKTPRYMSDIDPVGERERERRRKEKQRIYQQHKQATAAVAANRASAEGIDTSQMSKEERRLYALQVNTRNPRDNFRADEVDTTDYLSNPSGHPDHDNMAERGRKRRQERQTILRQEEEKMQAEAKRRQASRDKAKKRRWLRERDAAARRSQKEMLDEENQNRGKGHVVVEDHGDEGDLSSDTDSDDDRRHTVNKAGIDAFVKRQEEAVARKQAKVKQIENELKAKHALKWQTTTPTIVNGETGDLALPPAPPNAEMESQQYAVAGTGSRAALALSKARAALGEPSPRREEYKPKVVSLGL